MSGDWREFRSPCVICGHTGWCGYVGDPERPRVVRCMRVESKVCRSGGWLHFDETQSRQVRRPTPIQLAPDYAAWHQMAEQFQGHRFKAERVASYADSLGVTSESLRQLGIGWNESWPKFPWAFPMRDHKSRVIGIRLRNPRPQCKDEKQRCVKGSKQGLFIPDDLEIQPGILICEGETDVATARTIGIPTIGIPGAGQATIFTSRFVQAHRFEHVVVVGDNDGHGIGQRSALELGMTLNMYCHNVRVIFPPSPHNDLRDWIRAGATLAEVRDACKRAGVNQWKP